MKYLKIYENNSEYKKGDYVLIDYNGNEEVFLILDIIPLKDSVNQYDGMVMSNLEEIYITEYEIIKKLTIEETNFYLKVKKYNL